RHGGRQPFRHRRATDAALSGGLSRPHPACATLLHATGNFDMASAESAAQQTRGILLYLVCVIVLSGLVYTLFFAPTPFAGGGGGHYVEALMWCPAIAAFLALLLTRGDIASLGLS